DRHSCQFSGFIGWSVERCRPSITPISRASEEGSKIGRGGEVGIMGNVHISVEGPTGRVRYDPRFVWKYARGDEVRVEVRGSIIRELRHEKTGVDERAVDRDVENKAYVVQISVPVKRE